MLLIALLVMNKLVFMNDVIPKLSGDYWNMLNKWIRNNNMMISWILNSILKEMPMSTIFFIQMLIFGSNFKN